MAFNLWKPLVEDRFGIKSNLPLQEQRKQWATLVAGLVMRREISQDRVLHLCLFDGGDFAWARNEYVTYEVHQPYVDILTAIDLTKIPGSAVQLPFDAFAITLPDDQPTWPGHGDACFLKGLSIVDEVASAREFAALSHGVLSQIPHSRAAKVPSLEELQAGQLAATRPGLVRLGYNRENSKLFRIGGKVYVDTSRRDYMTTGSFELQFLLRQDIPVAQSVLENVQTLERDIDVLTNPENPIHATFKAAGVTMADIMQCMAERYVRLALAVSFLATGNDKIVEPGVLGKDWPKYEAAKASGDTKRIEQLHEKATKRRHHRSFVIGKGARVSVLPRRSAGGAGDETERELQYQHQRCGHFHGYHTKEGYKVKWVRQLTVRPDLPPDVRKRKVEIRNP